MTQTRTRRERQDGLDSMRTHLNNTVNNLSSAHGRRLLCLDAPATSEENSSIYDAMAMLRRVMNDPACLRALENLYHNEWVAANGR